MEFKVKKFKLMHITNRKTPIQDMLINYLSVSQSGADI